jgi:hypothetical protein
MYEGIQQDRGQFEDIHRMQKLAMAQQSIDPFRAAQIAQEVAKQKGIGSGGPYGSGSIGQLGNAIGAGEQRMPEVSREIERLERLIGELWGRSESLGGRLHSVLRSSPSPTVEGNRLANACSSPLAAALSELADRMEGNLNILGDLLNRLEV